MITYNKVVAAAASVFKCSWKVTCGVVAIFTHSCIYSRWKLQKRKKNDSAWISWYILQYVNKRIYKQSITDPYWNNSVKTIFFRDSLQFYSCFFLLYQDGKMHCLWLTPSSETVSFLGPSRPSERATKNPMAMNRRLNIMGISIGQHSSKSVVQGSGMKRIWTRIFKMSIFLSKINIYLKTKSNRMLRIRNIDSDSGFLTVVEERLVQWVFL